MVNGLRKIARASGFLFEAAPYIYIQKMELMEIGSVCLYAANGEKKEKQQTFICLLQM
jgi:hypothetical protein